MSCMFVYVCVHVCVVCSCDAQLSWKPISAVSVSRGKIKLNMSKWKILIVFKMSPNILHRLEALCVFR